MKPLLMITLLTSLAAPASSFALETAANPTPVKTVEVNGKKILADRNELTAYVFDVDAPDTSNCSGNCAKIWPPILLSNGETTAAPYGETKRSDGTRQITFNHRPIYRYVHDQAPRETKGDGLNGTWHIIVQ